MKYHFVGIKGAGMSSLAQIVNDLGEQVQGSDKDMYFFTQVKLEEKNIPFYPYDKNNISNDMVIVQGNSIGDDHEEIKRAKELNLKILTYQDMLKELTKKYKSITITGCHGKTTTTSMLAHVLDNICGTNYLIGDATGHANKENEYFVLEACEYKRHFLNYIPSYTIITNIDLDHPDYFKDIEDVIAAYQEHVMLAEKMVIACGDDPYTRKLKPNVDIVFYGVNENNDIVAKNIKKTSEATNFSVYIKGNHYGDFSLPLFGDHMLLNALSVIAVCYYENIKVEEVEKYLKTFKGATRRYSETKVLNNIVVDDYAHHPTEVEATIKTTKQKYPNKKIVGIFQPHTFSRTKTFAKEFIDIFKTLDYVYIFNIHPAREVQEDFKNITSDIIINNLDNAESISIDEYNKLMKWDNTVLLFMSPNDISKIEKEYISAKNN